MVNPVSKTLSTLQSAYGLTKGIADLNEVHAIKAQIGELLAQIISAQESALAAQSDQLSLIERVRELEEDIASLKTWTAEKERYELAPVGEIGALAYASKEGMEPPEPSHHLCANCYSDGKKSILQKELRRGGRAELLVCHRCNAEIYTFGMEHPTLDSRRRR